MAAPSRVLWPARPQLKVFRPRIMQHLFKHCTIWAPNGPVPAVRIAATLAICVRFGLRIANSAKKPINVDWSCSWMSSRILSAMCRTCMNTQLKWSVSECESLKWTSLIWFVSIFFLACFHSVHNQKFGYQFEWVQIMRKQFDQTRRWRWFTRKPAVSSGLWIWTAMCSWFMEKIEMRVEPFRQRRYQWIHNELCKIISVACVDSGVQTKHSFFSFRRSYSSSKIRI